MSELGTWQTPAADDISPDALEYLFSPKFRPQEEPPWVKVSIEPAPEQECALPVAPETIRMNAKVEVLGQRLQQVSVQLQTANFQIGYLKGRLLEKEEALKMLPEFRFRAAKALVTETALHVEREKTEELAARINELQAELDALRDSWVGQTDAFARKFMKTPATNAPYMPVVPWIMLMMFWFTVAVTVIGLREHWWVY